MFLAVQTLSSEIESFLRTGFVSILGGAGSLLGTTRFTQLPRARPYSAFQAASKASRARTTVIRTSVFSTSP